MSQIWDRVPPLEETVAQIDAVTTGDVRDFAETMAAAAPAALALYGPVDAAPSLAALAGAPCGVMLRDFRKLRIETERMTLRPPVHSRFPRLGRPARAKPRLPHALGAGLGR